MYVRGDTQPAWPGHRVRLLEGNADTQDGLRSCLLSQGHGAFLSVPWVFSSVSFSRCLQLLRSPSFPACSDQGKQGGNDSLWLPAVPVGSLITLVPDVRPGDSLEQNVLSVKVLEGGVRTRRL